MGCMRLLEREVLRETRIPCITLISPFFTRLNYIFGLDNSQKMNDNVLGTWQLGIIDIRLELGKS